jgi:dienelactone hydrolase
MSESSSTHKACARSRAFLRTALILLGIGCHPKPAETPAAIEPTPFAIFEGEVKLPTGASLRYSAILAPDPASAGSYLGTIDVPAQALSGATLQEVRFSPGERVEFALPIAGNPHWIGNYDSDGTMDCHFSQGEIERPCSMQHVLARPVLPPAPRRRRQTPLPPFPYAALDVKYANAPEHRMLVGTLTVPVGAGPHPAVLLVNDRGAADRNATRFGHQPFLVLADHLTRAGVSVLRVDDRDLGDADAPGVPQAAEASDVRAGLAFLRARPDVDGQHLGLLGHGAGAALAAQVAASGEHLGFLILIAPEALTVSDAFAQGRVASPGVTYPLLMLSGDRDREVDETSNGIALRSVFPRARLTIETLPGLNHLLQHAETGDPAEYEMIEETWSPEALQQIASWITTQ